MGLIPLRDFNPVRQIRRNYVTLAIIIANVAIFFIGVSGGGESYQSIVESYGLVPAHLTGDGAAGAIPAWATLFTSMFLHGGVFHLLGNMLYLHIFGDNVEDAVGHFRMIVFYGLCGLAAGLVHVVSEPGSAIPTIGASGAVSGMLGAYLMLHPRARILVVGPFFMTLRLPAFAVLGLWIVVQVASAAAVSTGGVDGGIAFWAHVGGFAAGAVLIVPFRRRGVALLDRQRVVYVGRA
ncbi:MAG: rhomboid family intramembrane serine protease, partial [Alphaproteobacteria bacterium]